MKHALQLMMGTIVLSAAWSQAQAFSFGPTLGSWSLPAGNDYYHIDAQVPAGEHHGVPMVVGGPSGTLDRRSLLMAHDNAGVMTFGSGMLAPTLWESEGGNDPYGRSIVNDLRHMPDGSPLLIGASSSTRALPNSEEATIWRMNSSSLTPVALGFPDNGTTGTSRLVGGNSQDGYAGTSADPIFVPPTGGGHTLDAGGVFRSGIAFDVDNFTTVGKVDFHAAFWSRDNQGTWKFGSLQLPDWSDGTGQISDVADGKMGGYLYKPDLDDIVPVLWNTDGTLNKVFDLPGYSIAEMVVDEGSVVTLLNQGTDGFFSGPSRIYADGWSESKLYFGDIVPALPNGTSGTVIDFASGGGLWTLLKVTDASAANYEVSNLPSSPSLAGDYDRNGTVDGNDYLEWQRQFGNSVAPWSAADGNGNGVIDAADYVLWRDHFGQMSVAAAAAVPEPAGAFAFLFCAVMFGRSFRYVCAYGSCRQRDGTAR